MNYGNPNDRNTSASVLALLQGYAPNGAAQQACSDMYNQMQADGLNEREVSRRMVSALHEGLSYDLWPWSGQS